MMRPGMLYAPPRPQAWSPGRASYRPDLRGRPTLAQLEQLLGASTLVRAVEVGIGGAIAYLGFYHGVNATGAHKWLGWIVGAAGSLYALSSLSRMFKVGQIKQTVDNVTR